MNLGENLVFNLVGFDKVVAAAIQAPIAPGLTIPVTPLPLYVLLKLVAFRQKSPRISFGLDGRGFLDLC